MEENKTAETPSLDLNEILMQRREKLAALKAAGKNPYEKVKYARTAMSADIKADYPSYENKTVGIAGRLISKRVMGKASFAVILDGKGTIQSYLSVNDLGDSYADFKDYDIGDIIGITGFVFTTRTGEISVHAKEVELLSKSLLPLPEKYHGLKDEDTRYRNREVDLIANPEVKKTFTMRSKILTEIRRYLDGIGYLEVDTPVLQPLEIGAAARPFKTHHNALDIDMYLRIETELYLKRLIVGGFDRVYEVGRIFRNEGMDRSHNPEFTTVEMYQAYSDYKEMMDEIEDLYRTVAKNVCGTTEIVYQGVTIDLGKPWERLTMAEAVEKYAGVKFSDWKTDEDARKAAKDKGVKVEEGDSATKVHVLIAFFDAFVEEKLIDPTIIYDYPVENSPLAKRKPTDPAFTERFEYFIYAR
ncbi:MAG: lysine--tRNA ligase, partial [Clostridia bacterium]|nr:lysine--tRNA ligase [Clostridia bacterium]